MRDTMCLNKRPKDTEELEEKEKKKEDERGNLF